MFFLSSFHQIFPWIFDAFRDRFGLHFGILLAPASSKKSIRIADQPRGGPLVRLASLLHPFGALRGPIGLRFFLILADLGLPHGCPKVDFGVN